METLFICLLAITIAGCVSTPELTRQSVGSSANMSYTPCGISRHLTVAKGKTNLKNGYKDHPRYTKGKTDDIQFDYETTSYLSGIENDLKEIQIKSTDASDKVEAVSDAIAVRNRRPSVLQFRARWFDLRRESNFDIYPRYPEFPDFIDHFPFDPIGNDSWSKMLYERAVLNFYATAQAYIDDGKHFVKNCENDYEQVRKQGVMFTDYLKTLDRQR